jgi:hypothetical protein
MYKRTVRALVRGALSPDAWPEPARSERSEQQSYCFPCLFPYTV